MFVPGMQCILSRCQSQPSSSVQGMSEAETSHEVHRFTCQARSKLEGHLDLRLEGLGRLTGQEVFSHELIIPPGKQSALGNTLQLTLVPGCLKQPGDPLRWARVCGGTLSSGCWKGLAWGPSQVGKGLHEDLGLLAGQLTMNGHGTVEAGCGS